MKAPETRPRLYSPPATRTLRRVPPIGPPIAGSARTLRRECASAPPALGGMVLAGLLTLAAPGGAAPGGGALDPHRPASAADDAGGEEKSDLIFAGPYFRGYDTRGRLGITYVGPAYPGGSIELLYGPTSVNWRPRLFLSGYVSTSPVVPAGVAAGTPYEFRNFVPYYGHVSGWGFTYTGLPPSNYWYVIPVDGEVAHMEAIEEDVYSGAAVAFYATVVDSRTSATLAVPTTYFGTIPQPLRNRGATLYVEYDGIDNRSPDQWRYPPGVLSTGSAGARWGITGTTSQRLAEFE